MKKYLLLCFALVFWGNAFADNHAQPTVYGQYITLVVSDPGAVAEAMTRYRQSPTGQKLSSNVVLSASIANGTDQATHTVAIFYPSAAAMEADMAAANGSADRAAFFSAVNTAATVEAENVFTQTMVRANDETLGGPGVATMLFGLTVFDNARYTAALNSIFNSDAAKAFPGNVATGQVIAMGEVPGTHWVSFQAKDIGTLLSGVETFMSSADFAAYAKDANEFRRVEGRYISRTVLVLGPQ